MGILMFLYDCGQISTPERHEFILMSDVLGLSALVDMINSPGGATEGSNLGPFYLDKAPVLALTGDLRRDRDGAVLLVQRVVKNSLGNPLAGAFVDTWQADAAGTCPIQEQASGQDKYDLRGIVTTNDKGEYWYTTVLPKPYTVPYDGPVERLLRAGDRHAWRAAHLHFIVRAQGCRSITTELFFENTDYINNDAVFGVRKSLITKLEPVKKSDALPATEMKPDAKCRFDVVLAPEGGALDGNAGLAQDRPAEFVEALAKGLGVLECFDAAHPDMTLSEIARRVGLSPAAARRSLITLGALGYVGLNGKRFHLRPKVMSLGSGFYFVARIDELLLPELRQIVEAHGDAASVAMLDGADVIYIAHHSTQRARRATAVVGARYPAHATSLGRVLLAGLPDDVLERTLAAMTPVALTDKAALRAVVHEARVAGFATTVDQLDYGITALAVPVRGADGRVVAALNSSGYSGLVTPGQMIEGRLADLRAAAGRIGAAAGRVPALSAVFDAG